MKRKLFLHIGTHKTGTTSIQRFCYENRKHLESKGMFLATDPFLFADPEMQSHLMTLEGCQNFGDFPRKNMANSFHFAHVILRQTLDTPMRIRGVVPRFSKTTQKRLVKLLRKRLGVVNETNVILSAEALSFIRTHEEIALLHMALDDFDIIPICFFRKPDDWLKSWEGHVRRRNLIRRVEACSESVFDFAPNSWLVDHATIRQCFGSNGHYIDYEDAVQNDGSTVQAFIKSIGCDPLDYPDASGIWLNRSS